MSVAQFLNYFLFPPDRQFTQVAKLSGGERRRLYLMTILMKNPNFLILDEPTNDLDIYTLNVLEDFLQQFRGCVIIVSHDRFFMDKVVEHLFVFEGNGKVKDYPGNYSVYSKNYKPITSDKKKQLTDKKESTRSVKEKIRKLTFKEKIAIEALERKIADLETEKSEIENSLNSGILSNSELVEKSKRFTLIIDEIEKKTLEWMELSEIENNLNLTKI